MHAATNSSVVLLHIRAALLPIVQNSESDKIFRN